MRIGRLVMMGAAALVAVLPGTAQAVEPGQSAEQTSLRIPGWAPEPWQPYDQAEFSWPAGEACSFEVAVEVVSEDLYSRVLARYPDGSVRAEQFTGPLLMDFVNTATGARVQHDLSGEGVQTYTAAGAPLRFIGVGPFGTGFGPADDYPAGVWVLDGIHVVRWSADGTKSMEVDLGPETNVCTELD